MLGGFDQFKPIDDEVKNIALNHKNDVESKLEAFNVYEPLEYQTQIVAGTNYQIKVHVGNNKNILVKVHKPLPYTNQPTSLMEAKNL